jgi:H+-transporting ATPase
MITINIVFATLMATFGWFTAAVSLNYIAGLFVITLVAMLILDAIKVRYYRITGILGTEQKL